MKQRQVSFVQESEQGHDFGTLLKVLRVSKQVRQTTIVALLLGWSRTSYTRLENGELPPHFDQLYALYRAFHLAGISFTLEARQQFLDFARVQINKKKTHLDKHSDTEWAELRYQLARLDGSASTLSEEPTLQKSPIVHRPLLAETSHLLGREEWHDHLLSLLTIQESKKVLILRGPAGIGKSSEVNWLATYLFRQRLTSYRVILCDFRSLERVGGPEEAFEVFLGTLLTELGYVQLQATLLSWEERTMLVLEQLEKGAHPTVILLDHSECVLHASGLLAACWERFLTKFLRSKHLTTLVFATKQWPGWYEGEQQFVAEIPLPPLSVEKGVLVLQQLGLEQIPVSLLQDIYARTGGIPLCLEWVAALVKQPLFADDWEEFTTFTQENERESQRTMTDAIHRLLQEPHLFGGSVADELAPFLERILSTQRLSSDANALLQTLSVATLPLAKPALQVLCPQGSRPLKELRRASVLVAYPDRAQLLPMVAAAMYRRLSPEQVYEQEEILLHAYRAWFKEGTVHEGEKGLLITELSMLLLKHHCLLEAAELLTCYGWISFTLGHASRLARLAAEVKLSFDWHTTQEDECGGLLLYYLLSKYLGESIAAYRRAKDHQYIYVAAVNGRVKLLPTVEIAVMQDLMLSAINSLNFEEAQKLLESCWSRLEQFGASNIDLKVSLLEKRAWLSSARSEYAAEQNEVADAKRLREQAIAIYKQCAHLLLGNNALSVFENTTLKRRLARILNDLGYLLNREGRFEEALQEIEKSIILKEQGYVQVGSLAASYGEKAETLSMLGRFQEALLFDEKALMEVQRWVSMGHSPSQEEVWVYRVNRGRLYLRLGKVHEAEKLLREALPNIHPRRRMYQMFAKGALGEIEQWRQQAQSTQYQLDWRWIEQYRELASYDGHWWLAYAGPFTDEEQRQWNILNAHKLDDGIKEQLATIMAQSRQRELTVAVAEQREPRLFYPAIDIEDVRSRISALLELDARIQYEEPNAIVRKLYREAIAEEEVYFLRMIEATYEGDTQRFWEFNLLLNPTPTPDEVKYALSHVKDDVVKGLSSPETRAVSQQLLQFLRERLHLSIDISENDEVMVEGLQDVSESSADLQQMVSVQAAKRFFESVLFESGYEDWHVIIDPNASGPRVEQGLRQLFLPDTDLSVERIRHYFSHEIAGHVARCIAGERSPVGLLGIHTRNSLPTEEGFALYQERQVAALHGQTLDDSSTWLGTLATGLASGVLTPPQTFLSLCTFFEFYYLLFRLSERFDENRQTAQEKARKTALSRCLRTFRGVPDLTRAGVCYIKDAVYLSGLWKVEQAVAQDESVLDRLAVGVVALEQLPDLQELGIVSSPQPLKRRAYDPDLDSYILSFEQKEEMFSEERART